MAICHRDYHSTEKDMYYSTLYILHFTQSISSTTQGWGLGTRLQFTQSISLTPQPPHRFNPLLPLTCSCCTSHSRQPGDRQDTPYIAHLSSAEETPSLREAVLVALGPLDAWFDVLLLQSIPPLHPHQHLSPCLNLQKFLFRHATYTTLISAHHPLSPSSSLCSSLINGPLSISPPSPLLNISFSRWYSLKISCTRNPEKTSSWNSSR